MIASQTLAAIEQSLQKDNGAAYRVALKKYMDLAQDPFRADDPEFRSHLGASTLGRECPRDIWYNFRWFKKCSYSGALIRLFNRGHLEEPRFLALLEMIGCEVVSVDAQGKQLKVKGGHDAGSLDGVLRGIPECPEEPLLLEFKTHNEKSFLKLKDERVIKSKWQHFVQMTYYMGKLDLKGALYMAVNKNTDELYAELVAFDKVAYDRILERVEATVNSNEPPARASLDKTNYKCKFCDYREICHGHEKPVINCRTCIHSISTLDGKWGCKISGAVLSVEAQLAGCDSYKAINGRL